MPESRGVFRLALSIAALVGAILLSLTLYELATRTRPFLTTSSPKGTYTVLLTGRQSRPRLPFVTHSVWLTALKNGQTHLPYKHLLSGDWFDPSFEILYPQYTWESDNVLHFHGNKYVGVGSSDILVVINSSGKHIQSLTVRADDMFFLFDIQPGSTIKLFDSASRGDGKGINVESEFSGEQSIKETQEGFRYPDEGKGPFTYYIYINSDRAVIESQQLEKYKGTE